MYSNRLQPAVQNLLQHQEKIGLLVPQSLWWMQLTIRTLLSPAILPNLVV